MGRIRRGIGIFLLLCMCMVLPVSAEEAQVLSFSRITVNMPDVKAELRGADIVPTDLTARLGTEDLQIAGIEPYGKAHSMRTYILIDLSGSVWNYFQAIKDSICSYVDHMNGKDELVVLTFGETEVESILDGSETKAEIKKKINALECDENGTLFYEALNRAYQLSNATVSEFDRECVIVFSDGVDVQKGGATYEETKNSYKTHTLPVYMMCTTNATQNAVDKAGRLARLSGGAIQMMNHVADFEVMEKIIQDVTLVHLTSESYVANGNTKQLSVKVGELQAECNIPIKRAQEKPKEEKKEDTKDPEQETVNKPEVPEKKSDSTWLILAIVVVALLLGGAVAFICVYMHKRNTNQEETDIPVIENVPQRIHQLHEYQGDVSIVEQHHIRNEQAARIRMRIKTGRTSEQNIEVTLTSSLIVGRSDSCDVYIDDTKMSRQHFVIEKDENHYYIMDLQSSNGTTLNGIRVNARQPLKCGDRIVAGLSDIYIMYLE